jgi:hypothetical protein
VPITLRQLRSVTWNRVYQYDGGNGIGFTTFACDIERLTVTHDFRRGKRTRITYMARGQITESPSQAVRLWNQEERRAVQSKQG